MDITESFKGFIFKAFIIFFSLCTLLWLSVIFYGLLYYLYIPAVAHIKPVYLQYDMSCFRGKQCYPKFPFDNITLIENGNEFLRGGQGYAIELVLEMPESERNWIQGIFMIKLDMINSEGRLIRSTCRAAMLRYRSPLFKVLYTLFFMPGLLAGSFEEKQSLVIPLFENYIEDSYNSAHFTYIEIQAKTIEVYNSFLRIHAQFTGLRYLMYYWPVFSAVVGIGVNFIFLVVTVALIWFYESTKATSNVINTGQSQKLISFLSRNKKTKDILQPATTPRCGNENVENEPEYGEFTSARDSQTIDNSTRIEGENIIVENLPRHRTTSNQLGDDD